MFKKSLAIILSAFLLVTNMLIPKINITAAGMPTDTVVPGMIYGKYANGISVDGNLDETIWNLDKNEAVNVTEGTTSNNKVHFDTAWDSTNLYVAIKVMDSIVVNNGQPENLLWKDDTVEIFIDGNRNKGINYDASDVQIFIRAKDNMVYTVRNSQKITLDNLVTATRMIDGGYTVEMALPWRNIGVTPKSGTIIGIDVANDDCDTIDANADRSSALTWNNKAGNNYATTVNFGEMMLIKDTEPLISTEGTPEIDGVLKETQWNLNKAIDNSTVTFGSLCDTNYLYFAAKVIDPHDNFIEIFIDGDNNKGSTYDSFDRSFKIGPNKPLEAGSGQSIEGVRAQVVNTDEGYTVEVAVPWSGLGITPQNRMSVGFDIAHKATVWSGNLDNVTTTENFGNLLILNGNVKRAKYTGPRDTVTDTTDESFSKVFERSQDGLYYDPLLGYCVWKPEQYLTYKSPSGDMISFEVQTKEMGTSIELYASKDNIEYTKLTSPINFKAEIVTPASNDTGWYASVKYTSLALPSGTKYLKLKYVQTNLWETTVTKVSFDYRIIHTGSTITVTDNAQDFSKILDYDNLYISSAQGFNTSKFHTWTNNAYMIYKTPSGSILSFEMITEEANMAPVPSYKVYGSEDGVSFKEIPIDPVQIDVKDGWIFKKKYSAPQLDWGINYIKIDSLAGSDGWAAGIANVTYKCVKINQAPLVQNEINAVTQVNTAVSGTLTATDPDGDSLSFEIKRSPEAGTAVISTDQNWTYTPNDSFIGYDSFEVQVSDGQGAMAIVSVKVLINYAPTNLTYYVSAVNGSDTNNGLTESQPFKTIQAASDVSKPGDTIYIMNGVYGQTSGEGVVNIKRSGLPNAYITYKAFPGHKPVLKVKDAWNHIRVTGAAYIKIEDLIIEGNQDDITHEQALAVYNYMVDALEKGTAIDWAYIGTTNTNGISIASNSDNNAKSHHIEVRNLDISKCPGGGIGSSYADYLIFENNKVYDNCKWGIYGGSGISMYNQYNYDYSTETKNFIRNNLSYNNVHLIPWFVVKAMSDGNGIIIDDNKNTQREGAIPYVGRTLIENNITYGNGGSGIHSFSSANVDIINNTSYMNNVTPELNWGEIYASASDNVNIKNNILYGRGKKLNETYGNKNVVYDYNIYFNGTPSVQGENDIIADPGFIDKDNYNFKLRADSPAIDRGTSDQAPAKDYAGTIRPQGNAIDIGAYEYVYIPVKSNDASLKDLKINGATIPGFNPSTTNYNIVLPAGTTIADIPVVTAEVNDAGKAKVVITQASQLPGTSTIAVTAEDEITKINYTINFTVEEATVSDPAPTPNPTEEPGGAENNLPKTGSYYDMNRLITIGGIIVSLGAVMLIIKRKEKSEYEKKNS
jgi:hypothetical protein